MSAAPDFGAADPALVEALQAGDEARIRYELGRARLLVAVIAIPGHERASEGEMALALLESADGQQALPAFTGLPALSAWRSEARPVPRPASEVIAYAVAESLAAVVLDPGTPHAWTLWRDDFTDASAASEADSPVAGYGPPTWQPGRKARIAAAPHEVYAVDTEDGPAVAVICPDGTLDADWAQELLAACPAGTGVLALPPQARSEVQQLGIRLTRRGGPFTRSTLT